MNISMLEPFGIFSLAGGLLYSMTLFMINVNDYKFHFIIQTLIIFLALFVTTTYKYLKYKFTCEKMDEIIQIIKSK